MKFEKNDYVVVNIRDKKELVRIEGQTTNPMKEGIQYYGILEKFRPQDRIETVTFDPDSILAYLGNDPKTGSVYGCNVEIFRKKRFLKRWGDVYFYRILSKEELKNLKQALQECLEAMDVEFKPFITEIRESKGNEEGYFKSSRKSEDIICLKPEKFDSVPDIKGIVFHELGHSIWANNIPYELKAEWVLKYHQQIELENVSKEDIENIINDFVNSKDFCKSYMKRQEDREYLILERCFDFVKKVHNLTTKHLDILIASNYDIRPLFDLENLKLSEMPLILSEYANKNPEEFFCEAVRLHFSGMILPQSLLSLLETTLAKVKIPNFVKV